MAEETQEESADRRTLITEDNIADYLTFTQSENLIWENGNDRSWVVRDECVTVNGDKPLDINAPQFFFKQLDADGKETGDFTEEISEIARYHVYVTIDDQNFRTDGKVLLATAEIGRGLRYEPWWKEVRGNQDDEYKWEIGLPTDSTYTSIQAAASLTGAGKDLFTAAEVAIESETAIVTLTPDETALGAVEGLEELTLIVDFGSSFDKFDYVVEIPLVISTKNYAELSVNEDAGSPWMNWGTEDEIIFSYTGEEIALPKVKISVDNEEIANAATAAPGETSATEGLTCTIEKNDTSVSSVKDSGGYRVEYVYSTDEVYGVMTIVFRVDPIVITEDNWNTYFTYTDPQLTWNGYDRWDEITAEPKSGVDIREENYGLNVDREPRDVGTYTVKLWAGNENYSTEGEIEIGTATISKAAYTVTDVIQRATDFWPTWRDDYADMRYFYEPKEGVSPFIMDSLTFTAVKGGEEYEHPENAGTYNIYLTLENTENYDGFTKADSGVVFVIEQREHFETTYNKVYSVADIEGLSQVKDRLEIFDSATFTWLKEKMIEGDNITPAITWEDGDKTLVADASFDGNTGELEITFAENAESLSETKSTQLTLCFDFNNIKITKKVVVTVTNKEIVDIEWVGENQKVYDGESATPVYRVTSDGTTLVDELSEADGLTVEVYPVDGQANLLRDAGSYELSVKYDSGNYYGETSFIYWISQKSIVIKGVTASYEIGSEELKTFLKNNIGNMQIGADGKGKGCSITEGEYCAGDVKPTIRTWLMDSDENWLYAAEDDENVLNALWLPAGTYLIGVDFAEDGYGSQNYDIAVQNGTLTVTEKNADPGNDDPGNDDPGNDDPGNDDPGNDDPGNDNPGTNPAPGNPGTTVTPPATVTPTTTTEPKDPDATVVVNPDGSKTETKTDAGTNTAGKNVEVTTTTKTDASGNVTSVTTKSVIENVAKNTTASVTVKTDGSGTITSAKASVVKTGTEAKSGTKGTVSAAVVKQITEAAGTTDVVITQKFTKEDGSTAFKLQVNASDLVSGESLYIVKINTKTGEKTLVNAKEYKVSGAGNVSVTMDKNGTYALLDDKEAEKVSNEILKTVKVKDSSKTVKKGKKTTVVMSDKLNMDNVKKVTYTTSKKSVATVDKNGKVTAKKAGTVTIKVKVTLKNGKSKTVKVKVKVK
ncbi:MAG: Ig-like domain-containing protein [Roseburia sp.]|nr:Ig-like domain-containing protein [Roseburia sp.]